MIKVSKYEFDSKSQADTKIDALPSDEDGNLVIYTNGVKLWNGGGEEVYVGPKTGPSQRLKTGAENATGWSHSTYRFELSERFGGRWIR